MPRLRSFARTVVTALCLLTMAASQTTNSAPIKQSTVPSFVRFSGVARDMNGIPVKGVVGIKFALYTDEQSSSPLWSEIQNVRLDDSGNYRVSLGASKQLPVDLFESGEARWLGVQVSQGAPEKRTLLLSVPYALKAGDAETIGGLPPSAFVLAGTVNNPSAASSTLATSSDSTTPLPPASSNVTTTGGTVNVLPLFSTATNIQNSLLSQVGTTTINVGGKLNLPATGAARITAGTKSRPQTFVASSFNSGTAAAVNQTFQWQAEPAANNTATPSGTLNLLFGSGPTVPAETGLKVNKAGVFTFALGQTFPGAGTLTGINTAAGSGLSGGGTTGNLTMSLVKTCATNQVLQWNGTSWTCATISGSGTITGVTAGTGLSGGGTKGNVTLSLNTTTTDARYAQLGAANAFTKNNSFAGTVGVGTSVPAAQLDVEAPATAATGIQGVTSSTAFFAAGVFGHTTGTSGVTRGVYGASDSPSGIGVQGIGQTGGQFETGTGTIFVGRGQGATRVTIDSLGNTATSGGMSAGGGMTAGGAVTAGNGFFTSVTGGATGLFANSDTGTGIFGGGGIGVLGEGGIGVYGASTGGGPAGYFNGDVQVTGRITSYNNTATVANGVPSLVFQFGFSSNGSGNNIYQNLYTPSSDGIFRITAFQECTANSGGGTFFSLGFIWTLPTGGSSGNAIFGPDCSSLNGSSGTVVAHVKGGTPIQYNYAGMNAPFQTIILIEQLL